MGFNLSLHRRGTNRRDSKVCQESVARAAESPGGCRKGSNRAKRLILRAICWQNRQKRPGFGSFSKGKRPKRTGGSNPRSTNESVRTAFASVQDRAFKRDPDERVRLAIAMLTMRWHGGAGLVHSQRRQTIQSSFRPGPIAGRLSASGAAVRCWYESAPRTVPLSSARPRLPATPPQKKILDDFREKYWQNRLLCIGPSRAEFDNGSRVAIVITPIRDLRAA
jgi:hypothetical protein